MENQFVDLMTPDKAFRVSYVKDKPSNNQSNNQFHDYLELFYQISGERHYFIKNQIFNIHKGDIVLINELELHRTTASRTPTYSRVLVHFRKSFLTEFLEKIRDIGLGSLLTESYSVTSVPLKDQDHVDHVFFSIKEEDEKSGQGMRAGSSCCCSICFSISPAQRKSMAHRRCRFTAPFRKKFLRPPNISIATMPRSSRSTTWLPGFPSAAFTFAVLSRKLRAFT